MGKDRQFQDVNVNSLLPLQEGVAFEVSFSKLPRKGARAPIQSEVAKLFSLTLESSSYSRAPIGTPIRVDNE